MSDPNRSAVSEAIYECALELLRGCADDLVAISSLKTRLEPEFADGMVFGAEYLRGCAAILERGTS